MEDAVWGSAAAEGYGGLDLPVYPDEAAPPDQTPYPPVIRSGDYEGFFKKICARLETHCGLRFRRPPRRNGHRRPRLPGVI